MDKTNTILKYFERLLLLFGLVALLTSVIPCSLLVADSVDDELMEDLEKDQGKENLKDLTPKKDFETLNPKEYSESRQAVYSKRPRPADLEFNREKVKAHVLALPKENRKSEIERYNRLKGIRDYLVRLLERTPYDSKEGVLFVNKNGNISKKNGIVALANERYLILRTSSHSKSRKIEWDELPIEQYERFFEFFASKRAAVSAAPGVSKEEINKNAAEDYITAAVMCDWYGRYEKALDFGGKALKLCPNLKPDVERLLMD